MFRLYLDHNSMIPVITASPVCNSMAPQQAISPRHLQDPHSSRMSPPVDDLDAVALVPPTADGISSSDDLEQAGTTTDGAKKPPKPPITYRADIDGLRTVAIVPVLLFHAYPERFSSGFVGVDVFFVISGYLISSILFKEMANGKFTYANFYARRVRRIFPTMLVVLTTTLWLGCLYLLADKLKALAATMLAGTLFGANLQLVSLERGYWDADIKENPLLHLWSLGVEEQFYFVWPCVVAYVVKQPATRALGVQLFLLVLSFIVNVALVDVDGSNKYAFYVPVARFWQMGVGSFLAYLHHAKYSPLMSTPDGLKTRLFSASGVLLLVLAFVSLDESRAFPGFWAVLPTFAAALLIAAGPHTLLNAHVLSATPVVYVGKISYALYLWHWPLLVFAKARYPNEDFRPFYMTPAAMLVLAFVLSIATVTNVEIPLRHNKSKRVLPALVLGMVVLCVVSATVYGNPGSFSFTQQEIDALLAPSSTSGGSTIQVGGGLGDKDGVVLASTTAPLVAGASAGTTMSPYNVEQGTVTTGSPLLEGPPETNVGPSAAPVATAAPVVEQPNSSRGPRVQQPTYVKLAQAAGDWNPDVGFEWVPEGSPFGRDDHAKILNPDQFTLIVGLGDSHLDQVKPRFNKLFEDAKVEGKPFPTMVFKTHDGTPALSCASSWHPFNMNMIKAMMPKVVLHSMNWPQFLRPGGADSDPLHADALRCCIPGYVDSCDYQSPKDVVELLRIFQAQMTELTALGIKVFAATTNPEGPSFDPNHMKHGSGVGDVRPVIRSAFRQAHRDLLDKVEAAIVASGATLIDYSDNQCWHDVCEVVDQQGDPIMKDSNHFRPGFARNYLSVLDQVIAAAYAS
ncbi:hypothetical protein B5M09_010116 [Aphanomyces astaci]|uniref:Acyltransferase 3 domain-containing protein n=2 Tax=Aphanomyces astaci TaxID=112090 RepID=A0A3R7WCB5_APHAT|nr:hypothetical protein B5M09_010116 [Aphanomyces astaci]